MEALCLQVSNNCYYLYNKISNGLDIPLQEDEIFAPYELKKVDLKIRFQFPKNHCALLINKKYLLECPSVSVRLLALAANIRLALKNYPLTTHVDLKKRAGSAKTSSRPIKSGKQNPPPQAVQLQAAKRMESFAKLNRKAQLYQAAMERFRRSLVYHNRRFSENIQETDLVNLDDQSEEVELSVALKRKQRNRERLNKRKAKSLAEKGSKPAFVVTQIKKNGISPVIVIIPMLMLT